MSDATWCWVFVWLVATFGWFTRIIHERVGFFPALAFSAVGIGLLIAALERRMGRNRKDRR